MHARIQTHASAYTRTHVHTHTRTHTHACTHTLTRPWARTHLDIVTDARAHTRVYQRAARSQAQSRSCMCKTHAARHTPSAVRSACIASAMLKGLTLSCMALGVGLRVYG